MRTKGPKSTFKDALTLGSTWSAFHHIQNKMLGVRQVSIVQTNAVAFKLDTGRDSWLRFDNKHTEYVQLNNNDFQIRDKETNELVLTYRRQLVGAND